MRFGELIYLVHPYTTYGEPSDNIADASRISKFMDEEYFNGPVISPINIVPRITKDEDEAMALCRRLYDACTAVCLSPNWERSVHCRIEAMWAIMDNKTIYMWDDNEQSVTVAPHTMIQNILDNVSRETITEGTDEHDKEASS